LSFITFIDLSSTSTKHKQSKGQELKTMKHKKYGIKTKKQYESGVIVGFCIIAGIIILILATIIY